MHGQNHIKFLGILRWCGTLLERVALEDRRRYGRILLKWFFKRYSEERQSTEYS